jgi:hypothetical protein
MTGTFPPNSSVYQLLCRILGGRDQTALNECVDAGLIPRLMDMAHAHDALPALAVRCHEQQAGSDVLGVEEAALLRAALLENTRQNMGIIAQSLKLTRRLNDAGITPLFLKGTARLLVEDSSNRGFRKQIDIDLLVQPHEIVAAAEAIAADGYRFYQFAEDGSAVPVVPGDAAHVVRSSTAHHHLPPLVNEKYSATVELHRHFLPGRFQRDNPLDPLFATAHGVESHGAAFRVPSTEHQLIHLILGTVVHDGHLARRSFPVREACDLIELLDNTRGEIDERLVMQRCGSNLALFYALVCELMAYRPRTTITRPVDTSKYLRVMQKRYDSPTAGKLLDAYARAQYLVHALVYSPAKLPAYLHRTMLSSRT